MLCPFGIHFVTTQCWISLLCIPLLYTTIHTHVLFVYSYINGMTEYYELDPFPILMPVIVK